MTRQVFIEAGMTLDQVEYILVDLTLEAEPTKGKAAKQLGVSLKTLYNLIRKHGLESKYIEQRESERVRARRHSGQRVRRRGLATATG